MSQIIVGSQAAKHYYPDFPRECADTDIWTDFDCENKWEDGNKYEYKNVLNYPGLLDFFYEACSLRDKYMDPSLLYTLKVSHAGFNIHWAKTIHDIIFFQRKGLKVNDYYLQSLKKEWEGIHGKKKGYLNKSNEDFFRDNVKRIYQHDDLHKVMAFHDEPLYKACKRDQSKAMLDKSLFDELSFEDKLNLAREETMVTALERFVIPSKTPAKIAYRNAIKKLITSMTRGFFADFLILNINILKDPDDSFDFVQKFEDNKHKCRKELVHER